MMIYYHHGDILSSLADRKNRDIGEEVHVEAATKGSKKYKIQEVII